MDDAELESLASTDFSSSPEGCSGLGLAERWVLASLSRCIIDSTAAHDKLEFGEAGRLLYDFLWNDFADWYIEVHSCQSSHAHCNAFERRCG